MSSGVEPYGAHLEANRVPNIVMPPWKVVGIDVPGSTEAWYIADRKQFDLKEMGGRQFLIRHALDGEFDPILAPAKLPPSLWVRVMQTGGLHYRVPFWRGYPPFERAPLSDAAVSKIVHDCIARGGYDKAVFFRWHERIVSLDIG